MARAARSVRADACLHAGLESRKAEIDLEASQPRDLPKIEEVKNGAQKVIAMIEQFHGDQVPSLKELLRKLLPQIEVENGSTVYPVIHLPMVLINSDWVGPTDHKTNRFEVCSDVLNVAWTSRWEKPEVIARRSEIQRTRHADDPLFHEIALRNLEKGRLNEWKEEQILGAIRNFYERMGRAPRYGELRREKGLPDYKTIWRKFGSSRIAIAKALGPRAKGR